MTGIKFNRMGKSKLKFLSSILIYIKEIKKIKLGNLFRLVVPILVLFNFVYCESNSNNTNVLASSVLTYPVVTSLEPRSVNSAFTLNGVLYPASTLLIRGRNFSANANENTVQFNGTSGVVTASTTTELTVTVPAGVYSGVVTVSKLGGLCTSLDKKSGINCGGTDIYVSCYAPFKDNYGSQVLLEANKANKVTFTESPLQTKSFRVDLLAGLRTLTLNCPTNMNVTTFSKVCSPTYTASVTPSISTPQISIEGGYTMEFFVTTQPGDCTFTIY